MFQEESFVMNSKVLLAALVCVSCYTASASAERQWTQVDQSVQLLESIGERAEARAVRAELAARAPIPHADVVKKFKELDVLVDAGPASLPKVIAFINQLTTTLQAGASDLTSWAVHELAELKVLAQAGNHAGLEAELHKMIDALTAAPLTRPVVLAWLKKLDALVDAGNCAGAVKMIEAYEHDVLDPNSAPLASWTCDRLDAMLVPLRKNDAAGADKLLKVMIAELSKP